MWHVRCSFLIIFLASNLLLDINIDEATNGGQILGATGSPLLTNALLNTMRLVPSPLKPDGTVYDDWANWARADNATKLMSTSLLSPMGTGSDYTVFFHHMGIPSLDLVFSRCGTAVYPYHSNYDSYFWVEKFGDPGFRKHLAMTRLWGILAVRLAGIPLLSFKANDYATTLHKHLDQLVAKRVYGLDLESLKVAIAIFMDATLSLDRLVRGCDLITSEADIVRRTQIDISEINKRYREIERSFIMADEKGLPGRAWYKHMVSLGTSA